MTKNKRTRPETVEERIEKCRAAGRAGRGESKQRTEQMKRFWERVRAGELPRPKIVPRGKGRGKQLIMKEIDNAAKV